MKFLLMMQNLNLIMKKQQRTKLEDIPEHNWPVLFKNVKVKKDKDWGAVSEKKD